MEPCWTGLFCVTSYDPVLSFLITYTAYSHVHPGDLALLYESWWKTRRSIIWTIAPDRREEEKKILFDRCVVSASTSGDCEHQQLTV
jgi:hypothetical protein